MNFLTDCFKVLRFPSPPTRLEDPNLPGFPNEITAIVTDYAADEKVGENFFKKSCVYPLQPGRTTFFTALLGRVTSLTLPSLHPQENIATLGFSSRNIKNITLLSRFRDEDFDSLLQFESLQHLVITDPSFNDELLGKFTQFRHFQYLECMLGESDRDSEFIAASSSYERYAPHLFHLFEQCSTLIAVRIGMFLFAHKRYSGSLSHWHHESTSVQFITTPVGNTSLLRAEINADFLGRSVFSTNQ